MKRMRFAALLLSMLLLCACGADTNPAEPVEDAKPGGEETVQPIKTDEPEYDYDYELRTRQFTDESSGKVYAMYRYSVPMMRLTNADLLEEDALLLAQRNVESFNAYMQQMLEKAVAFGEETARDLEGGDYAGNSDVPAADEKEVTVMRAGNILTVVASGYFYSGGAHPVSYTNSDTFDLSLGQFIDPAQIGDDPEKFRVEAAALLVAKAESLGEEYTSGFWSDYADIIANWNDAAVLFDEGGMTVVFSVYELGPYAMGPVELFLTYEELADAIGAGGLAHLGVASAAVN